MDGGIIVFRDFLDRGISWIEGFHGQRDFMDRGISWIEGQQLDCFISWVKISPINLGFR